MPRRPDALRQTFDFDLFVIGGGSGGVRAGRIAGSLGKRVGLAEERFLGGTCVNVGCIPKKLLVYASEFAEDFEDAAGFGWTVGQPSFDWPRLVEAKNAEIARLNGIYRRLLGDAGVTIFDERARIAGPNEVEIGARRVSAETILVATGGRPDRPAVPGCELYAVSDDAFYLERFPSKVMIVGGGYIAVEFAGIFRGLGAEVSLIHRGSAFLRGFDDDLRRELAVEMGKRGIELVFDTTVVGLAEAKSGEGRIAARLSSGDERIVDLALAATGRLPHTADLGLENAGVALDALGAIRVDATSRTSVESIYAIGDCTNRMNLTPVAIAEAMAFVDTVFRGAPRSVDYAGVPTAVFSQPNLGTVGLTEAAARAKLGAVDVYRSSFRPLKHTLSGRDEKSFLKLVVERSSQRVVGAHMLGPDAGEIVQGLAIALHCRATKADFDATIGIHPTLAEEFVTMRTKSPDPE
jgi:glutathione reductase (NADPH)